MKNPQLGIPTANIPVEGVSWIDSAESGVYFGWAGIQLPSDHPDLNSTSTAPSFSPPPSSTNSEQVVLKEMMPPCPVKLSEEKEKEGWRLYPMVMSIGYNPFYKNTVRSAEVHVLQKFEKDFYGSEMRILIMGYIRPEYDYIDLESLVKDIMVDCEVAGTSLGREKWGPPGEDAKYLWNEA
jgi:riboflavin kinase